ncbi:MAG: hypothetical protein K6E22_05025 [Treponema sp.]|nr:hypothetical protein [Treponema sp.]
MILNFDIPEWLIIVFVVVITFWPLLVASGSTSIVALITALLTKSSLAFKVAGIAALVFLAPLVIGFVAAPVIKGFDTASSLSSEKKEDTPLIRAVKKQDAKKVAKLLKKGADPNEMSRYKDRSPLGESCLAYGDEEKALRITKMLLDAGADPNIGRPMENAVVSKRHGAINLLLDCGYRLSNEDGSGRGIVEFAVIVGNYKEAILLLERGVLPCERYNYGSFFDDYTIFMYVFRKELFYHPYEQKDDDEEKATDLVRIFSLLLEKGVDVNLRTIDHRKETTLIILARNYTTKRRDYYKLPLLKLLLDAGADVNVKDSYGKTALHYFAEKSWAKDLDDMQKVIELLVSYGADKSLLDGDGLTALDVFHRSCRRDDRGIDPAVYDKVELLLTPVSKKRRKSASLGDIKPKKGRVAAVGNAKQKVEVETMPHTTLQDMGDAW